MRIMITNGGPHPPAKWAVVTAEHICPIDGAMEGDRLLEARQLQVKIAQALIPHHTAVQDHERGCLKADGDDHFNTPLGPQPDHLDAAVDAIVAASVGSPWESHFAKPEVQAAVRQEVGRHFTTVQDVERQWHADKHPHHEKACAYKRERHPEPAAADQAEG